MSGRGFIRRPAQHIVQGLKDLRFNPSEDPCLFTRRSTVLVLYLDDAALFSPDLNDINQAVKDLQQGFSLIDEGDVRDYHHAKRARTTGPTLHANVMGCSMSPQDYANHLQLLHHCDYDPDAALLRYPDPNRSFHIYADASDRQLGSFILQGDSPVAYFSRNLTDVQTRYSTIETVLLSVYETLRIFRPILYGSQIHVYTDHCTAATNAHTSNTSTVPNDDARSRTVPYWP